MHSYAEPKAVERLFLTRFTKTTGAICLPRCFCERLQGIYPEPLRLTAAPHTQRMLCFFTGEFIIATDVAVLPQRNCTPYGTDVSLEAPWALPTLADCADHPQLLPRISKKP